MVHTAATIVFIYLQVPVHYIPLSGKERSCHTLALGEVEDFIVTHLCETMCDNSIARSRVLRGRYVCIMYVLMEGIFDREDPCYDRGIPFLA